MKHPDFRRTCAGHVLYRHSWVDLVLVEQIDVIGLETLQRRFCCASDVVRRAIDAD